MNRLEHAPISEDCLCKLEIKNTKDCASWSKFFFFHSFRDLMTREWKYPPTEIVNAIRENTDDFSVTCSRFFETILQSIETKGWVDIENDYYQHAVVQGQGCEQGTVQNNVISIKQKHYE